MFPKNSLAALPIRLAPLARIIGPTRTPIKPGDVVTIDAAGSLREYKRAAGNQDVCVLNQLLDLAVRVHAD